MENKQYTIGEFATLNKVTPRMLRHYDKIGLLKPATISANGYRSYSSSQIVIITKIKLYQYCQFSLSQILELLNTSDDEIKEFAKEKIKELKAKEMIDQEALKELTRLSNAKSIFIENHYDISYTHYSTLRFWCATTSVLEENIEVALTNLYNTLDKMGISNTGMLCLLPDLEKPNYYKVALSTTTNISHEGYEMIQLEKGWYLSTFHYGGYYSIGYAYDYLYCYAKEKGYQLDAQFIERYFVDSKHTFESSEYITQVIIKITP